MKKNYWTTTEAADNASVLGGSLLVTLGIFSTVGVFYFSTNPLASLLAIAAAALLSSGVYVLYRILSAPHVSYDDSLTLSVSWGTVKDAKGIGRNRLLRKDSNAKAAVKAIVRDHQELVRRANWNHDLYGSHPSKLRDLQEVTHSMNEAHTALKETLREREYFAGVNSARPGSREAARRLREGSQLTDTAKRSLEE